MKSKFVDLPDASVSSDCCTLSTATLTDLRLLHNAGHDSTPPALVNSGSPSSSVSATQMAIALNAVYSSDQSLVIPVILRLTLPTLNSLLL